MLLRMNISLCAALLWAAHAAAQSTLGELLDAGATKLSPEVFKEEVVQRMITGPTGSGGTVEVMYAKSGVIAGRGQAPAFQQSPILGSTIGGEWKINEEGKICASMRILQAAAGPAEFPHRCQYWYKLGEQYYLSESDSDRHARVLRRTLKQ